RRPIRPLGLALDRLHAGPGKAFAADADAVAHRLAAAHHQVEVGVRRVDDDRAGRLAGPVVDDLTAKIVARVRRILLRIGIGRRRYWLALRAEQRLERIERVGGSPRGRDGARGDEGDDRGSGLQAGKIVHGTSPFDAHWSNGGVPGFKMLAEINLTAWLPVAAECISSLISLGFLRCRRRRMWQRGHTGNAAEKARNGGLRPAGGPPSPGAGRAAPAPGRPAVRGPQEAVE